MTNLIFRAAVVFLSLSFSPTQAQLLKNLKKGLQNKVDELADPDNLQKAVDYSLQKMQAVRDRFDTTNFNYAIAVSDDATGLFHIKEKGEDIMRIASNLNQSNEKKTEAQKARGLVDLAETFYASHRFKWAENNYLQAKAKYEGEGLTEDPNYLKTLANLGLLYGSMGRYSSALQYTDEALQAREQRFGKQSAGYAASLNNRAVLSKEIGKYNEAEEEINEAIRLNQWVHGDNSMPYAIALNNKAMLYQALGRYEEAVKVLKQGIDISEGKQSEKSANHQRFLTNLALLYQDMQQYEKSEETFLQVIQLKEKRFGTRHPDYAHMLNNLASLYVEMGKDDDVEDLLLKAANIYKKKLGENHPSYADVISDLGNFYRYKGRTGQAEPLLKRALEVREQTLGTAHPDHAQSMENLAILYWKLGDYPQAAQLYQKVLDKSLEFIRNYFPPMSEAEKTNYWDKLRPQFQRFYSFALEAYVSIPEVIGHMYDYHLATKALLLDATHKIRSKILGSGDHMLIDDYLVWIDKKEALAQFYTYSKAELQEQKVNLDSLERIANELERSLSARSEVFSRGYEVKNFSYQSLRNLLGEQEAVVEIIRINHYEDSFTGKPKYAVLILKGHQTGEPEMLTLADGQALEERYFKYYFNAIHQKVEDEYSYPEFWQQVEAKLTGVSQVYLSSDGIYNQLNINTLKDHEGAYMIEKYDLTLLTNSKELASIKDDVPGQSSKALLMGFPTYGADEKLKPLPGTEKEVSQVSRILRTKYKVERYQAELASESNLKRADNPKILHVATHGFFLEDAAMKKEKVFGINTQSAKDNPLLRSGLLLAGAGNALQEGRSNDLDEQDDGILTAYEATNLSLDDTDLVVLSACETGRGDVKAGEGVYGLQRAFLVSGANAIIMSLWKVSDEATQQLMVSFYNIWLRTGDKQKAFKQAQLLLKTKYPEPFYWGGFVMVGR